MNDQPVGNGQPVSDEPGTEAPESARAAFRAGLEGAVRSSAIGHLAPGEVPRASALLKAIGGVRGLTESILPGLGFLVVYTITRELVLSVLAPVAVAICFVAIRLISRTPASLAFAGLFGVGVSAILAMMTGRTEDNFLPGLIINVVSVVVLVTSIAIKWPFIGIIVGFLSSEGTAWRENQQKRRVLMLATWLWVGLFSARLLVQAPLYLSSQTDWLAAMKLIMGVPLYAAMVWVTWLLVRTVYPRPVAHHDTAS
ncbi:MAG: DUF3159 domain-containing protein [Homoserinimonas sp.]